ncbi:MAG: ATP-binding protein [Dermatophilaceae bacterium]
MSIEQTVAPSGVPAIVVAGEGDTAERAERELRADLAPAYRIVRISGRDPARDLAALADDDRERVALLIVAAEEPARVITAVADALPRAPRALLLTDRPVHHDLAAVIDADLLDGVVAVPWTDGRLAVQSVAQVSRWLNPLEGQEGPPLAGTHDSPLMQLLSLPMEDAVRELVAAVERVLGPRPRLVLPAGTRVTREEVSVDGLLVVLRGEVSLGVTVPGGEEIRLHHASTGPLIGLPALAERRRALVTARATTEVELIHLTLEQLDHALTADPRVGALMTAVSLRSLSRRLRRAEILQVEKTELNAALDAERARLAEALKALSDARLELVAQARSAAIGDMAAGIAHELNSPLAALLRTVEHAESDMRTLLSHLPGSATVNEVVSAANDRPALSAKEERTRRRELEQAGVPARRARALVAAGIGTAVEARRIHDAGLDDETVDSAAGLGASLRGARLAMEHIATLVQSLRSAMRPDGLEPVPVQVADTLEDALRLTAHRLSGIEVVRRYAVVPPVLAHPGQLTQVWTNLLTNAADAMEGQGTLEVSVTSTGRGVRVQVVDSGPGIPDELRERIFEPRFTTKSGAVRFGLGLGLGIARRIITDHDGTIAVTSEPGSTVFTIDLPAALPEEILTETGEAR